MSRAARLALLIGATLVVASCGSSTATPPPGASSAAGTASATVAPSASTSSPPGSSGSSGGWGLTADPAAGLAVLGGYRAHLVVDASGTMDGQDVERHSEITYARDARGSEEWLQASRATGSPDSARHVLLIGGARYDATDDGCLGAPITAGEPGAPAPDGVAPVDMLLPIRSGTRAGSETIGGVVAAHFTFDASGLAVDPASIHGATVRGELWVADPGGYVLRYTLEVTPAAGEQTVAEQHWAYEVVPVSNPITLPPGCPPVPLDVPVTPDATDVQMASGGLNYHASGDPEAVAQFYWTALGGTGWTLPMEAVPGTVESPFGFTAEKDGRRLSILLVAADGGGTDVAAIVLEPLAPRDAGPGASPTPEPPASTGPAPTPKLPAGVPVYPAATDLMQAGPTTYTGMTDDTGKAVVDWYAKQLGAAGWTLSARGEANGMVYGQWTRGDQMTAVSTAPDAGRVRIVVHVE